MSNALVIAAHPDDEILGIGGTMHKHVRDNGRAQCLILAQGAASRDSATRNDISRLREQGKSAAKIIGYESITFLDFPDNKMDSVPLLDIVKAVEKAIDSFQPNAIYTHHGNDLNIDHQLCFKAVLTACRPPCKAKIFTFETLSSTEWQDKNDEEFRPNVFIDIKEDIDAKIKAMKEYVGEMRAFPHPRSAEGIMTLAKYRGMESGLELAEALCLIRAIK